MQVAHQHIIYFKELLWKLDMQHGLKWVCSIDIIRKFPHIPVKKALERVREELDNDNTLSGGEKCKVDEIMKLLEI